MSLTQSLRMLLARHGVSVRSVLTGPVDTEMTRGLEIPKASPESVARAIFDGIENGDEDIFPDVLSQALAEGWRGRRGQAVRAPERSIAAPRRTRRELTPEVTSSAAVQAGRVAARSRATDVRLTGGATGIRRRHDLLTDPQKHSSLERPARWTPP